MDEFIKATKDKSPEEVVAGMTRILRAMHEQERIERIRRANARVRRGGRPALRASRKLLTPRGFRIHLEAR